MLPFYSKAVKCDNEHNSMTGIIIRRRGGGGRRRKEEEEEEEEGEEALGKGGGGAETFETVTRRGGTAPTAARDLDGCGGEE